MGRLGCVVIVMVYGIVSRRAVVGWIVGTLIIDSVCYRKTLTWGCGALRGVLRHGLALVGVGVGTCYFVASCGVCCGEARCFRACGLGLFGRWGRFWGVRSL